MDYIFMIRKQLGYQRRLFIGSLTVLLVVLSLSLAFPVMVYANGDEPNPPVEVIQPYGATVPQDPPQRDEVVDEIIVVDEAVPQDDAVLIDPLPRWKTLIPIHPAFGWTLKGTSLEDSQPCRRRPPVGVRLQPPCFRRLVTGFDLMDPG